MADKNDLTTIVSFQLAMAKETEDLHLDRETTTKGVFHVLENPTLGEYLLACSESSDGKSTPVGCLLLLKEWSDWRNKEILWVHSVYIDKNYRKQKIFTQMYDWVQEKARTKEEIGGIRLYVSKKNLIAQKCYQELGMDNNHYELFEYLK